MQPHYILVTRSKYGLGLLFEQVHPDDLQAGQHLRLDLIHQQVVVDVPALRQEDHALLVEDEARGSLRRDDELQNGDEEAGVLLGAREALESLVELLLLELFYHIEVDDAPGLDEAEFLFYIHPVKLGVLSCGGWRRLDS